ncbi:MAG: hypothetical protein IPK82_27180 [Polyangiaceae bacterium]|nr:hypothetical protein [Polyangiaceae bacterium]
MFKATRFARGIAVATLVYLLLASLLGTWIVDDAGISFAYARNASAGFGLVAQPGQAPVEGFSNLLWVLLLTAPATLRALHPVFTAKFIGGLCVVTSLYVAHRCLRESTQRAAPATLSTLFLAASPPIVIWSVSGLENGLTLLLAVLLFSTVVTTPPRWPLRAGILAGLLGAAHPGGMVFALVGPLYFIREVIARRPVRLSALRLAQFAVGSASVLGPLLAFRFSVFGRPLPHTYYAKRVYTSFGERLWALISTPEATLSKGIELWRATFATPWFALLLALAAVHLAWRGRLDRPIRVSLGLALVASAGFVYIDDDWMGETRFGTAAVAFWIIAAACFVEGAVRSLAEKGIPLRYSVAAGALFAALWATNGVQRIGRFAANPTTPFAHVSRNMADKFNAYTKIIASPHASVLLPDVGAMLWSSDIVVIDAAGLCEPNVIRTLKRDGPVWLDNHPMFFDWVFNELRPTFISTHHFWTRVTAFDTDPRFARDYVPINAYQDAYVHNVYGLRLRSGDFVRRDALPSPEALGELRAWRPAGPPNEAWIKGLIDKQTETSAPADTGNPVADAFARAVALDAAVRPEEARVEWQRVLQLAGSSDPALAEQARLRLAGIFDWNHLP